MLPIGVSLLVHQKSLQAFPMTIYPCIIFLCAVHRGEAFHLIHLIRRHYFRERNFSVSLRNYFLGTHYIWNLNNPIIVLGWYPDSFKFFYSQGTMTNFYKSGPCFWLLFSCLWSYKISSLEYCVTESRKFCLMLLKAFTILVHCFHKVFY